MHITHAKSQRGQVLLIVTLTMIIALTVGLAIVSRTITNLKISKQNEESQRAFQAAEAGLEKALQQASSGNTTFSGNFQGNQAGFTTKIQAQQGNIVALNGGGDVVQAVGFDLWLANYPNFSGTLFTGNLQFYYGTTQQIECGKSKGSATTPALEVVILYNSIADPRIQKFFFDSCVSRRASNNATAPVSSTGDPGIGMTFTQIANVHVDSGLLVKVIPVYNSTKVAVAASLPLPVQGFQITSTGSSGESVRKIQYFDAYPQIPIEVFPYAIVSQ